MKAFRQWVVKVTQPEVLMRKNTISREIRNKRFRDQDHGRTRIKDNPIWVHHKKVTCIFRFLWVQRMGHLV